MKLTFNHLVNVLSSSVGKDHYIIFCFIRRKKSMRVRVSVRHFFLLLSRVRACVACVRACVCACVRACVRACVCVCFFILYFFTMVCILFRINFQIHLGSHALHLAGNVSIGAVVGFRRKIDHHWLMFFLYRDRL